MSACPDYEDIKRLAQELGRPAETLIALAPNNDPFYRGLPSNKSGGEWFAEIWATYEFKHLRRAHYVLSSQPHGSIRLPNGKIYENTLLCWHLLCHAAKHCRYLNLSNGQTLIDRRNPDALIFEESDEESADPQVDVAGAWRIVLMNLPQLPAPPRLRLSATEPRQRYLVEVWVEKSGDLDDVLVPLCQEYSANLIPAKGEQSLIAREAAIERYVADGRPVRVLYLSDFDPGGQSMPLAVARKLEFAIRNNDLDLDVQVRPIALTAEQCMAYRLPRTPIKETEARRATFEDRYGEGATELDALEALRPSVLRQIVEKEIQRYRDASLVHRFSQAVQPVNERMRDATESVLTSYSDDLKAVRAAYEDLEKRVESWQSTTAELWQRIADDLAAAAPSIGDVDWPEAVEGAEQADPLFDSRRSYVQQIDRYKAHQGRPTERRERRRRRNGAAEIQP
jgi:hypothetical protein